MLSVSGKKFVRPYCRIKGVDHHSSVDIKEILYDTDLTSKDKVELRKVKIESVLKNLKSYRHKHFTFFNSNNII